MNNKKIYIYVVLAVAVFICAVLVGYAMSPGSTSVATKSASSTNVVYYTPPTGALSYPTENGSCFANSIAAPYRADAWRCMVGNGISDPCFQVQGSKDLLCGLDPTGSSTSSTFLLKLTAALPKTDVSATSSPGNLGWFIKLYDGTVCTPFTGTRPFSAEGDVAEYACNSSVPGESMLFNGLNNSATLWTAEVGTLPTSSAVYPPNLQSSSTVPVETVWQ